MGDVFLEVFCNFNIWFSFFVVKLLIILRDEWIWIIIEVEFIRVYDDIN